MLKKSTKDEIFLVKTCNYLPITSEYFDNRISMKKKIKKILDYSMKETVKFYNNNNEKKWSKRTFEVLDTEKLESSIRIFKINRAVNPNFEKIFGQAE